MKNLLAAFVVFASLGGGFIFLFVMPILLVKLLVEQRRTHRHAVGLLICSAMIAGFFASGVLCWNLVPPHWNMSFWTTVEASVNVEKYGHPIEHAAEVILVWVLFASVSGALAFGALAAVAARLRTRFQRA